MPFDQLVTFLPVADLTRSAQFYEQVLELELVLDQGDCRIFRVASDSFIGICQRPGAKPSEGVMVTLVTPNVDAWHRRLSEMRVVCDRPPTLNQKYRLHHAFYRDPDGHVIEIQTFLDPSWPG